MTKKTTAPVETPEPREGERSEPVLGGGGSTGARDHEPGRSIPDPELPPRAQRRRFSAAYKLRIVREAEACTAPGEIGALLRREGLYTSHLSAWRKARRKGTLQGLMPKKRGVKPTRDAKDTRIRALEAKVTRLEKELDKAHTILDVQGKVAGLLGLSFDNGKDC